jgi:hypothetical protein
MSELAVGSLKGLAANAFKIEVASGSQLVQPGSILQVVSTRKIDTFTTTSTTFTPITGLSATITPTSATSKILVLGFFVASLVSSSSSRSGHITIFRGANNLANADSPGSRTAGLQATFADNPRSLTPVTATILDSPATISPITYEAQAKIGIAGDTFLLNRANTDTNDASSIRGISEIILMEVAG